jgi:hypothetical protein
MEISNFESILLHGSYLGVLWMISRSASEIQLLSMLHHSITPILHEISTPAGPNSSIVALQKNIAILTGQYLAASALPQALPSCQEERGGQFGKI